MINDLHRESLKVNFKMKKTEIMHNNHVVRGQVMTANEALELVEEYIYLGQPSSQERTQENRNGTECFR